MCKKEVIIVGTGGHGRVIADIIKLSKDTVFGFLDDNINSDIDILGTTDDYIKFKDKYFIIAIGDNSIRKKLAEKFEGVKYYTAIHPASVIADSVTIKEGTAVMAGAVINNSAKIGRHSIINSNSTIEHDCEISDFCHISPGAVLCGTVNTGSGVWIGARAVVKNNLTITHNVTVGAGGVVVKNIEESGVYTGIPCKRIK